MQVILTNVGQRWCLQQARTLPAHGLPQGLTLPGWRLLLELMKGRVVQPDPGTLAEDLIARGLVEAAERPMDPGSLALRLRRNPLEHLSRVAIEYTTACGSHCLHCRNAAQAPVTETDPGRLFPAVDLLLSLGLRRFDFIGGEVLQFGDGWLDVVRHIRGRQGTRVAVLTSGWFLERNGFTAAGRSYGTDQDLLEDLAREGVAQIVFSLDGPEPVHDRWRRAPGLYRRVLAGFEKVRRAGLIPRVSIISRPCGGDPEVRGWLLEVASALYPEAGGVAPEVLVDRLLRDAQNYVSNLVDVGGAAALRSGKLRLDQVLDGDLRCKAFFRPAPSLRLNAGGEVATCPLMGGSSGFGNLRQRGLLEILNHLQETPLFRLHAEKRIAGFRSLLDRRFFPDGIDHVCTLRVAVSRLALLMHETATGPGDAAGILALNRAVARAMGESLAGQG